MIRYLLLSIFITLLAWTVLRVLNGVVEAAVGRPRRARPPAQSVKLVRDPICGTYVTPGNAVMAAATGAAAVHFCSERCRDEFVRRGTGRPQSHAS